MSENKEKEIPIWYQIQVKKNWGNMKNQNAENWINIKKKLKIFKAY